MRADNWSVAAIAAAHGATESAVKKLLALGSVSPALMQLFRDDKIKIEEMQALASVPELMRGKLSLSIPEAMAQEVAADE